ncbi:MAG: hypothetical protein KDJ90_17715 [Nitratireductor sp.]|nr:hypothetical protein [Nitratireductor sp.]
MSPEGMRAAYPSALSFARLAMADFVRRRLKVERLRVDLDEAGRGEALYRVVDGERVFHLFVISQQLPAAQQLDRNFATAWDATAALCEGSWSENREAFLRREIPKQTAGWVDCDTLIVTRANRSGRLFDAVVDSLSKGLQPDPGLLTEVGYIMRTTGFIGNGAIGTRPFAGLPEDHPLYQPYFAQMFSAFLLREFVFDLVDSMAAARSRSAVRLDASLRRFIGLGNSAATGLTRFMVNHPEYMHQWGNAQEAAFACAKMRVPTLAELEKLETFVNKAAAYFRVDCSSSRGVFSHSEKLAADLDLVAEHLSSAMPRVSQAPLAELCEWSMHFCGHDATEILHSIILEIYPDIIAHFSQFLYAGEPGTLDPLMTVGELKSLVVENYAWVEAWDWGGGEADRFFWFHSVLAPADARRGNRHVQADAERENAFETVRQVRLLSRHLDGLSLTMTVAELAATAPQFWGVIARIQSVAGLDYAEMRDNPLREDFSPFPSIRKVLAFFGMERFESAPSKVVRGALLQGAPIAEDVARGLDGDWPFALPPEILSPGEGSGRQSMAKGVVHRPEPDIKASANAVPAHDIVLSPVQFATQASLALQGAGAPLGLASHLARYFVLSTVISGRGLQDVARTVENGVFAGGVGVEHLNARAAVLRSTKATPAAAVLSALNIATAKAYLSHEEGTAVLVGECDGPEVDSEAMIRFAGLPGFSYEILRWRGISGTLAGDPRQAWLDAIEEVGSGAPAMPSDGSAYLVLCSRTGTGAFPRAGVADPVAGLFQEAARKGVRVPSSQWQRLVELARGVLLSAAVESRLREDGFDPTKEF